MRSVWPMLGAAAVGAIIAAGAVATLRPSPPIGGAVRAYLLDHPEVIPEAMDRYRQKETGALVAANRAAIATPFAGAWAGAARPKVVVTEFYDYACGYCRQAVADLDRLTADDPTVRVVFKQMPILSAQSDMAARVGLVAAKAGRFAAYHHALFAAGTLDEATIAAAARASGVDPTAADAPDIAREVDVDMAAARALRLTGTPSFVIGDQVVAGAVGYAQLKAAVDEARVAG